MVDARKVKLRADAARAILLDAKTIHVCQGKQVISFEPGKKGFDVDALLAASLGRSGNLRAPTLRLGRRLVVGWSEPGWNDLFAR